MFLGDVGDCFNAKCLPIFQLTDLSNVLLFNLKNRMAFPRKKKTKHYPHNYRECIELNDFHFERFGTTFVFPTFSYLNQLHR